MASLILKNNAIIKTNNKQILDIKSLKYDKALDKNIEAIIKKYGNKVVIKFNTIYVPLEIKTIKTYYFSFYRFICEDEKTFLMIDFYDREQNEKNGNSYIGYIEKSKYASGTNLIKLCLALQKALNVKKTVLFDQATIDCHGKEMDLSFIKLLEKEATYYMSRGFTITPNKKLVFYDKPADEIAKIINNGIKVLKSIKVKDIINEANAFIDLATKAVKKTYSHKIIKTYVNTPYEGVEIRNHDITNYRQEFNSIFMNNSKILSYLLLTKHKYLYTYLIDQFKHHCDDYNDIYSAIFENYIYSFNYENVTIKRPYILEYQKLIFEKNVCLFVHHF